MTASSPSDRQTPVSVGQPAPPFSGTTEAGAPFSSEQLAGRPSVIYFYPKARSMGCSIEAREFARLHDQFTTAGIRVVGVSVDSVDDQRRFHDECSLPFDLIADPTGEIARKFGVRGRFGPAHRVTFLIGPTGTVEGIVRSLRPSEHARAAQRWAAERPPASP